MPIRTPLDKLYDQSAARLAVYHGLTKSQRFNMKSLSQELRLNETYFHQYLVYGKPDYLPEDVRKGVADLLGIEEAPLRPPGRIRRMIGNFGRRQDEAIASDLDELQASIDAMRAGTAKIFPRRKLVGSKDLPVYGTAQGGEGVLVFSGAPVDSVARPTPLLHVADGYGVIVTGESMVPIFRPGDIALVHPHLPPRPDQEVILQREDAGAWHALIKTLVRETAHGYRLRQYNPPKELTLTKADWPSCHLIVGKYNGR